jgi:hypothetical protein
MQKALICFFLFALSFSSSAIAQAPCVWIKDAHLTAVGGPMNGTIAVNLANGTAQGVYTLGASEAVLTVTAGVLYGPTLAAGYCAPAGVPLIATYSVRRTGPTASGDVTSVRTWLIPSPASHVTLTSLGHVALSSFGHVSLGQLGPVTSLRVSDVELASQPTSSIQFSLPVPPATGCYSPQSINGKIQWRACR